MCPVKEFDTIDVNVAQLKQRIPLLEYLQRRNWKACRAGNQMEFVGLCPLQRETHPSFYVNSHKNLFYCHGCGRGGDLIRFVQLSLHLSFPQTLAHLRQQLTPTSNSDLLERTAASYDSDLLERTAAFYQLALHRHPEAVQYLAQRGLHDPAVIEKLAIGYAPGGVLRRHLCAQGYHVGGTLTNRTPGCRGPGCFLPPRDIPLPPAREYRQPLWSQHWGRLSAPLAPLF